MATTYGCPVAGVLPHSEALMELGSGGILVRTQPEHRLATLYRAVAASLVAIG